MAQIVDTQVGQARLLLQPFPRSVEIRHWRPLRRGEQVVAISLVADDLQKQQGLIRQCDALRFPVFAFGCWAVPNASLEIEVGPFQAENLSAPRACKDKQSDRIGRFLVRHVVQSVKDAADTLLS